MSLSEVSAISKRPLIIEINAEIRSTIFNTFVKRWKKIARAQTVYLFGKESYDVAKS